VSIQDANRVGAQDARYPAMSVLYTPHSLQDAKLEFGGFIEQNINFEQS
jgi:hypothetical protein